MEYTTSTYNWKILSIDKASAHMVVEYSTDTESHSLNIPTPKRTVDLSEWVHKFAPHSRWEVRDEFDFETLDPNASGTNNTGIVEESRPNVVGNWGEEYLRALVYQVLEELKDEEL